MKKNKVKDEFLNQLRKIPIIQVACEKVGLTRQSVYRWKDKDEEFAKEMEIALKEGEALVNDMSENQLLVLIKEKNWSAISFWLRHRNPKFRDKIEITTKISDGKLTPEQEAVVREALKLASALPEKINNDNNNNYEQQSNNSAGTSGDNDKGSESQSINH